MQSPVREIVQHRFRFMAAHTKFACGVDIELHKHLYAQNSTLVGRQTCQQSNTEFVSEFGIGIPRVQYDVRINELGHTSLRESR